MHKHKIDTKATKGFLDSDGSSPRINITNGRTKQQKQNLNRGVKENSGYPVIDINVDDDQVDDRVDEAIQYWNTFIAEWPATSIP